MQIRLAPEFEQTADGQAAEAIVRKCVHCGFCNATCPTYQLLGDELDGPRGRIYLMKQVFEGAAPTRSTQQHLDRCLTCRHCESTCPSGVEYGRLVDLGRRAVDAQVGRTAGDAARRWLLKEGLTSPLFAPAWALGQALRALVPAKLKSKLPSASADSAGAWPRGEQARKVLLLAGCVQPALRPRINGATARVLDAAGIQTVVARGAGCCGALRTHLNDRDGGLRDMRRNVDAWWPAVSAGTVEAIVMNASGCGVMVKDYGHALAHDPAYADKARRVAELTRDLSELLLPEAPRLKSRLRVDAAATLAFHPPCTLQHGQQLRGGVEALLGTLGFDVRVASGESLCCGSAGTYSVLQPELANALRERKLAQLEPLAAQTIVSANIGCIVHLQTGTATPVRHWVEAVDDALQAPPQPASAFNSLAPLGEPQPVHGSQPARAE